MTHLYQHIINNSINYLYLNVLRTMSSLGVPKLQTPQTQTQLSHEQQLRLQIPLRLGELFKFTPREFSIQYFANFNHNPQNFSQIFPGSLSLLRNCLCSSDPPPTSTWHEFPRHVPLNIITLEPPI